MAAVLGAGSIRIATRTSADTRHGERPPSIRGGWFDGGASPVTAGSHYRPAPRCNTTTLSMGCRIVNIGPQTLVWTVGRLRGARCSPAAVRPDRHSRAKAQAATGRVARMDGPGGGSTSTGGPTGSRRCGGRSDPRARVPPGTTPHGVGGGAGRSPTGGDCRTSGVVERTTPCSSSRGLAFGGARQERRPGEPGGAAQGDCLGMRGASVVVVHDASPVVQFREPVAKLKAAHVWAWRLRPKGPG